MIKRVLGFILCITILMSCVTTLAEEQAEYTFYIENKPVYFNENKPLYVDGEVGWIHFYDFVELLGFQIDGDIRNERVTLTDKQGNQYICYIDVYEYTGKSYLFIEYGYNKHNLYYGYQMPMNGWNTLGLIKWVDDQLYFSMQSALYFVCGMSRNMEIDHDAKTVYIHEEGTITPFVFDVYGMSGEYQDIYNEIRYTLLWDLLVKNFPKATMYDILDARANNPDNLYGMIMELEKFR